jgi:hypothetical protein
MKARLNGTNNPFVEIKEVSLADKPYVVYDASRIEFEQEKTQQEPTSDHWQDLRERAAIAAMQGFIAHGWDDSEYIVKRSIRVADALVEKLKGE